jgi:hypothetical protein
VFWRALATLRARALDRALSQPVPMQANALRKILATATSCKLGADLRLGHVRGIDDFRRSVPVTDYAFYRPYIDSVLAGHQSILFPGRPVHFGQTGGTTGAPKRLPLSRELLRAYRGFNVDMVLRYMAESGQYDLFGGKVFLVAANPEVERINDVAVGFITGIMASNAPALVRRRFVPGLSTIANPVMQEKIAEITRAGYLHRRDIRMAAGLTTYLMAAWSNLIEHVHAVEGCQKTIREIFPQIKVAFHGGSTFELFLGHMRALAGEGIDHRNVYSANEGPIAFQWCRESPGLAPSIDRVFFEFLPIDATTESNPRTVLLDEVERGKPYYIVLTMPGGLLRYRIGDVVEFVETQPPLLRVLGKMEDQIDLSAEKITVQEASAALRAASESLGLRVVDFLVCPQDAAGQYAKPAHEWIVEFDRQPQNSAAVLEALESRLRASNPMYRELRSDAFALGPPILNIVPAGTFRRYMQAELNYGQQKMLHMNNQRTVAERLIRHVER